MMKSRIERLKSLPQRAEETWQGGLFTAPFEIAGRTDEAECPLIPLWVTFPSARVHIRPPLMPVEADLGDAVEALLELPDQIDEGGYRPGKIEVIDPALAEHLDGLLTGAGIEVCLVEELEAVDAALDTMREHLGRAGASWSVPRIPGPLDGRGVTVEQMRSFAEAAADFYRAAPWQYLTDSDLIENEKPKSPRGMKFATVLGAGRSAFGLGFYDSVDAYVLFRQAGSDVAEDTLDEISAWQFSFDTLSELPPADHSLWRKYDLPVAGESAYPMVLQLGSDHSIRRPGTRQLSYIEGVLRTLASTAEAEIDSGRWQKEVTTFHGKKRYRLALPDLLSPPSHEEWMQRGFMPDRRAHERMFADIGRYFDQHGIEDIEEMNEVLNREFAGKRFDQRLTKPTTPLESAQQLCFEAFETHGRRRVQLARKAIEICPDCADAYVILAEQAGTLEAELDLYSQGVAAGKRALGPECFEDNAEHFWGATETRPYMRALLGLADSLEEAGRQCEAVDHFAELLRLNPGDNQGVRYRLLPQLLQLDRDQEAARLLKTYEDEISANWAYARALLAFRLSSRSSAARRELRTAYRVNPHVPEMMFRDGPLPIVEHYSPGSPEEAVVCAMELRPAFEATKGAMQWLASELKQRERLDQAHRKEQRRRERQKQKKKKRR